MASYEIKKETPANINQLKIMASDGSSWRERLKAVEELKFYDCQQSRDILTRLAIHDIVFKVKEAAFRAAQALGVTKGGKPLRLNKKPKGNLVKGISGTLTKVANRLDEGYSLAEFKSRFAELYPKIYDAYEGDKGRGFDSWLQRMITSLPKSKNTQA